MYISILQQMNRQTPITISKNNCENCFKCIRECDVKAINYNQSQAQVVEDRCISCGICVEHCPAKAITVRSDIEKVKKAIKNNSTIVASLSPGWITEFKNIEPHRMIEALKLLGFTHVSQTSIGATLVKQQVVDILSQSDDCYISNLCPSITEMINTYYPSLSKHIVGVVTPAEAHATYIKRVYGNDTIVITIDSCVATKSCAEEEDSNIYASLTFEELREYMNDQHVDFEYIPGNKTYKFEPITTTTDNQYIQPRGTYNTDFFNESSLQNYTIYDYVGIPRIQNILSALETEEMPKNTFIELFACKDGCLSGTGCIDSINFITKRRIMSGYKSCEIKAESLSLPVLDLRKEYIPTPIISTVTEEDITSALNSLYIEQSKDPKNCGSCGYNSCRSFASALAKKEVDPFMCVHYQKKSAQNKFKLLLHELSSGVAIVGQNMKIVEANRNFASLLGADPKILFDTSPDMSGIEVSRLLAHQNLISECMIGGKDKIEKDIQIKDKMVRLTIFTIQQNKMVGIIVRNRFLNEVKNADIIQRTNKVITDNLETVQQIAYLLGENASKTEAMLNSIIESQSLHYE